jgi:hypothetical protein
MKETRMNHILIGVQCEKRKLLEEKSQGTSRFMDD